MWMAIALLHTGASLSVTSFTVHPSTVIGIVGLAALYEWGQRGGRTQRSGRAVWFYTGLVTMFFALNGWLHDLSDSYLFSAHMVQHLVLTLVAPPLLIMGTPGWMLRPTLSWRGVGPVARFITKASTAFVIFNVVIIAWHLPAMYEFAVEHHPVHIVQHLCFMMAATLMWWPILSPLPELPRLSYPLQMLYLFLMTIPMSIVAICIGYSDHVLYPFYAAAPRLWGITPMQDQLIGALIMWIPGGLFFFTVISVIFFRWQQAGGDSADVAQVGWVGALKAES